MGEAMKTGTEKCQIHETFPIFKRFMSIYTSKWEVLVDK